MAKTFWFIGTFILLSVQASFASTAAVVSLYAPQGQFVGSIIPLSVVGVSQSEVRGAELSDSDNCAIQIDIHNGLNYLIYCTKETNLTVSFNIIPKSGMPYRINSPLLIIRDYGSEFINPDTTPGDNHLSKGSELYQAYCIVCHTDKAAFLSQGNMTIKRFTDAVDTYPVMQVDAFRSFSNSDIQSIVDYINMGGK